VKTDRCDCGNVSENWDILFECEYWDLRSLQDFGVSVLDDTV